MDDPVNQAIAYGPEVEYVLLSVANLSEGGWDGPYLVAKALTDDFMERVGQSLAPEISFEPRILWEGKGSDLKGTVAHHPMRNVESLSDFFRKPRPFLPGDFVTTEQGTGLVHMAPDHGEDDFDLCKANGIDPVFAVEGDGKYRADWAWLGGQGSVINAKFNAPDGPICEDLRAAGALLAASADYKHSYPHSWRSKAKLIFRATPQWFIPMDVPLAPLPEGRGDSPAGERGRVSELQASEHPHPTLPLKGEGSDRTLRRTALQAIKDTRWVPEKGQNRITAMVEGRPDWVISRQRAWGVPITLFVNRKTGQYLCDPAVNARIVAAVREGGVDAWTDERAQEYLGDAYNAADYERQTDILDVWFDSGCTHAFVLESGKWPDLQAPADLYLEGSDQHRGWFQSSLLESCGTRGRAPYKAVLTHGFTMDAKGMKMSKSLGNTINPLDLMKESGADILRLWALSVDFTEDHRIGKEILSGVSDQYRKLRNTFRYLLGALEGFEEDDRVAVADMPELERYVLHLLADMDAKLRQAVDDFDFNTYTRLLSDFANNDLSAFFFDIRKDSLYCDAPTALKRRAYRTVLDTLFHALVRYAAPVLVFTAEEVWGTRFSDAGSVHLLEWPEVDAGWINTDLARDIGDALLLAAQARPRLELARNDKTVGTFMQAKVSGDVGSDTLRSAAERFDMAELMIVAQVEIRRTAFEAGLQGWENLNVERTTHHKCGRCWRHLPEVTEDSALCDRCDAVVNA